MVSLFPILVLLGREKIVKLKIISIAFRFSQFSAKTLKEAFCDGGLIGLLELVKYFMGAVNFAKLDSDDCFDRVFRCW
ncbi:MULTISPECIES: hypothetical protein [unclassified Phormidium]|uniref:hypothetical protein n=1 Tax=Cyanophyceae TaxID=3028117 RepID=UPI0016826D5C|nr:MULTISPECIES: hypothetical protein [unclassified Phormidium]MBD2028935.1 hypothetical protein [Phormidium sp. FACHB-322]